MDNFEKNRDRWSRMSRQGREQETRKLKMLCNCPQCPSYNECADAKSDLAFCIIGKGTCSFEENGCICASCPVAQEWGLMHQYYCINGAELDVRGAGRETIEPGN
ncbi:MAG: hypothetical protein A4E32_01166 [Methanomassiliicoccales archaeon PtaU1.Bin124]|nr:MAG: hypothetical protein A4E32_01166 [Methanomassiliicoccales archaeon PtaU1.Bin124]